jgi:hypothetical protein
MRPGRGASRLAQIKGTYRYGLVLLLVLFSCGLQMLVPDNAAAWLIQALLMAATVLMALFAAGASRPRWRRIELFVGASLVAVAATAIAGRGSTERAILFGFTGLLAAAAALIVIRGVVAGIQQEQRVTAHSVMGVLTVYLLAGLIFGFGYGVMDAIAGAAVLSHLGADKHAEEVYFSYITLTTVGYGDIVPISGAARMTAAFEALFGQLYLVTIVAVIVSNVRTVRRARPGTGRDEPSPG